MSVTRGELHQREAELLDELQEVRRLLSGSELAVILTQLRNHLRAGDVEGANKWIESERTRSLLELHL